MASKNNKTHPSDTQIVYAQPTQIPFPQQNINPQTQQIALVPLQALLPNQVMDSQQFQAPPGTIIPTNIQQLTDEELKSVQKKEVENFPKITDCCYDKMFLNLMANGGLIVFITLGIIESKYYHIGTAAFIVLFIVDLFISNTFTFFRLKSKSSECRAHIDRLRVAMPNIRWNVQCYHYETRRSYHKGHMHTYRVRVNTHSASHLVRCTAVKDATNYTDIINHLSLVPFCRLYFAKEFSFDSQETFNHFYSLKQIFISRNKYDKYMDCWETFDIVNFKPKMCSYKGDGASKVYSIPFYLFMSVIGFGWLMRLLFYKNSFCANIRVNKVITI